MNIFGIYFICCAGNYLNIINEQLKEVIDSGLYNDTTRFFIFITLFDKNNIELTNLLKKYDYENKFILITTNENLFEKYAINNYKEYVSNYDDYYLYYFHTKGVSHDSESIFSRRRRILNFFTLQKYKLSIKLLEKYDAVGCSLSMYPKLHFSGNFWWSKKSHLDNLVDKISNNYLAPEMYICSYENGKYISLNNNTNNCFEENSVDKFTNILESDILNNLSEIPIENVDQIICLQYC